MPNLSNLRNRHPECFKPNTKGIGKPRGTDRNNTPGRKKKPALTGDHSRAQKAKLDQRTLTKDC